MQLHVPFGLYKKTLRPFSNKPVQLNRLFRPFGFDAQEKAIDEDLCIGLVLDLLAESFYDFECIDPMDVAEAAWDLGFQPARKFLDEGALLLTQVYMQDKANISF